MPAPTYRYEVAGLLSDVTFDVLPLPSGTFDLRIGSPGAFSPGSALGVASKALGRRLAQVIPGATAMYVYRNDVPWWGGPIWTTTPAGDEKGNATWTFQAATFDSYPNRVNFQTDLALSADDPLNQARAFLSAMQADPLANISLTPDATVSGNLGAAVSYLASANTSYGQAIGNLATQSPGFDYTASVTQAGGTRTRRLRLGYPTLGSGILHRLTRPGNILTYSLPADATLGGTECRAFGASTDASVTGTSQPTVSTTYLAAQQLAGGYPRLDFGNSYSTVSDVPTLNAHAQADLAAGTTPVTIPAITVRLDHTDITPDCLGDQVLISITDANYPDGLQVTARLVGIQVTTPDRSTAEVATLVLN